MAFLRQAKDLTKEARRELYRKTYRYSQKQTQNPYVQWYIGEIKGMSVPDRNDLIKGLEKEIEMDASKLKIKRLILQTFKEQSRLSSIAPKLTKETFFWHVFDELRANIWWMIELVRFGKK